jgi:glycosyltransferase involved in cell wall biosynthesis
MKRILMVEASGRGFLCHYAHALCVGLHEAGHQVRLVTGMRDELADWDLPFEKSACLKGGWRGWRCLQREVKAQQPDVVHLQWVNNPLSAIAFVCWARGRGVKVVYTPHNILPHRARWLTMPAYRRLYRQLDSIVARDRHLAWGLEEILDAPRRKMVFLPGSPSLLAHPTLHPHTACADIAELSGKRDGELRLLFFGHGCGRKGLGLLLEALSQRAWPAHLHLVIAGEEVMRGVGGEALDKPCGRMRISVVNRYLAPVEVSALMRTADLMLMPYVKQCKSPLTDMAAAFNIPVLRSERVKGACFEEGLHGVTIPHDDVNALNRCIERLTGSATRLQAMRKAMQREETVINSIKRLSDGHSRLYQDLCGVRAKLVVRPQLQLLKSRT